MTATGLTKAKIYNLKGSKETPDSSEFFTVQFNPASLKFQTTGAPTGGPQPSSQPKNTATPAKQTLSLELSFDTYDEFEKEKKEGKETEGKINPVSVVKQVHQLERFLLPGGKQDKKKAVPPPPSIRFEWAGFVIDGNATQLSVEYDHFHHDGTPLRAKCSLTIEVLDPMLAAPPASTNKPGSDSGNTNGVRTAPNAPGALRSNPSGLSPEGSPSPAKALAEKGAPAQAGESLAAFSQRNGLDPKRWRDLAQGINDVLSLPAGIEIAFSTAMTSGLGGRGGSGNALPPAVAAVTAAGGPRAQAVAKTSEASASAVTRELQAFGIVSPSLPVKNLPLSSSVKPDRSRMALAPTLVARPFGEGVPLRPLSVAPDSRLRPKQWVRGSGGSGSCGCG